jgi:Zn-finger nucleic acid-binding protein
MHELHCPGCGEVLDTAGRTDRCPACDGAWVNEDALVGMLQERTSALIFLPWQPRAADSSDKERKCAACSKPMQWVNLGSVKLDRCAEHGVWFDRDELAALLAQAKDFKPDHKHEDDDPDAAKSGLLHSLAKLFGGH